MMKNNLYKQRRVDSWGIRAYAPDEQNPGHISVDKDNYLNSRGISSLLN